MLVGPLAQLGPLAHAQDTLCMCVCWEWAGRVRGGGCEGGICVKRTALEAAGGVLVVCSLMELLLCAFDDHFQRQSRHSASSSKLAVSIPGAFW